MNKWTLAQEVAITENNSKILVSAAAGSGKTSVMIERVARLICLGESLDSMAICTFTKRAAADMKIKLSNRLKELADKNANALTALKNIAQADISTLHSWCSKLIKTYFYAVNVDPNFEIMPEASQKPELSKAIEKAIEQEVELQLEDFTELYDILRSGRKHSALANLVKKIYYQAVALPKSDEFLNNCLVIENTDEYYIEILKKEKALSDEPYAPEKNTLRHINVLVRLTRAVIKIYSAVKERKAWLDYSDLEQQALKLLQSSSADLVRKKYKYIFIDEYQDINPLQEELLKLDTNMFYVGDVKQSIYGFRLCAPEFFMAKRDDYIKFGTGKALELNKNWRSDNKILEFINKIFNRIMTVDFGKVDYKNVAAFEKGNDIFDDSVVIKLVKLQPKAVNIDEPKIYSVENHDYEQEDFKAEQKLVLQHILMLKNLTILEDNKSPRAVNFSDIAILVRARDSYSKSLMTLLKSAGIDCSFTDCTSISAHKYIGFLINYLKLIDNSRDDISMAGVMLEFEDFTNEDLAQIRIAQKEEITFFQAVNDYANKEDELAKKVSKFLQTVAKYKELASTVDANNICQTLVSDYDYFKKVYAGGGEEEAIALAEMLDGVENSPYNTSLYEYLQNIDFDSNDLSVCEKANSVKIMTIHSAKGLEFPFVILPNLAKKFDLRELSEKMLVSSKGISLKYFNYFNHTTSLTAKMSVELTYLRKKLLEEEMRIFYVALTRPIYQLALFASYSKESDIPEPQNAKNYLDWVGEAMEGYCETIDEQDCFTDLTAPKPKIIFKKVNLELAQKIKERLDFKSIEKREPIKTNVSKILSDSDNDQKIVYIAKAELDDKSLERGTAYHKVMELINFDAPFLQEWDRIINLRPDFINLVDSNKIMVATKKVADLAKGAQVFKEQPFVYNAGSLIQGIIDLLIIKGDKAIIVDYKTTRQEDLIKANYGEQLSLYAKATQEILGVTVQHKLVYSFDKGDFIAV